MARRAGRTRRDRLQNGSKKRQPRPPRNRRRGRRTSPSNQPRLDFHWRETTSEINKCPDRVHSFQYGRPPALLARPARPLPPAHPLPRPDRPRTASFVHIRSNNRVVRTRRCGFGCARASRPKPRARAPLGGRLRGGEPVTLAPARRARSYVVILAP